VIRIFRSIGLLVILSLAACGGSDGGTDFTGEPTDPVGFQPGVFLDANTFFAQCQVPRTGIDPATGQAYPDIQGTTTDENNFLRSYSNDTYLWYNEILDQDPSLFDNTLDYFSCRNPA